MSQQMCNGLKWIFCVELFRCFSWIDEPDSDTNQRGYGLQSKIMWGPGTQHQREGEAPPK